jgi:replication factor C subunit 3/5
MTNVLEFVTRLDVEDSGLSALVRLSNGDMRKALNILQVVF